MEWPTKTTEYILTADCAAQRNVNCLSFGNVFKLDLCFAALQKQNV